MSLSRLKNKISKLLSNPGVYIFYDKSRDSAQGGFRRAQIIYIGKATNLKSRVGSYFSLNPSPFPIGRGGIYSRPIETMIHEVADIKTIQTDSVLEALILESNLIKQHQPKYNAMGKDGKSFSYFVITKEKFPRVVILRETELDSTRNPKPVTRNLTKNKRATGYGLKAAGFYGPYTSKKQMEIALKIIRKIFPFHSNRQQTEKGCLDFQIGSCPGPYAGAITQEDYRKNIRGIQMILEGKKKNLVKKMEREMKKLSNRHDFERARDMRDKIFALQHIQDVALITQEKSPKSLALGIPRAKLLENLRIEAYDISNISGQHAVGSMVVFSGEEPDKSQYRKFKIKTIQGADDIGMMREVLLRRFKNVWPQPALIFLDGGKGHLNMGEKLLRELGMKIPIVAVAKGAERKNLELRIMNHELTNGIKNITKNKNFIKQVMDEAHRFAIGYHRKLRRKNSLK